MTILSDFFIATPEELSALDVNKSPGLYLPSMLASDVGIDQIRELSAILYAEVTGGPRFLPNWPPPGPPNDEVCILPIPLVIAHVLAEADDWYLAELAGAWDEATGWSAHGVSPDLVASLVREMAALARNAKETGRGVYVWLCESL